MIDKVSKAVRSRMMAAVRGRDTIPEKQVRSALFAEGFRFRLHRSDLPGSPDIVLPLYGTGRVRNVSMQPVPTELQDLSAKLKLSGTYLFEVLRTGRY